MGFATFSSPRSGLEKALMSVPATTVGGAGEAAPELRHAETRHVEQIIHELLGSPNGRGRAVVVRLILI